MVRKCEPGKVLVAVAVEGLRHGSCRAGQHQQQRYAASPASLVAGADAGAVVAVEILVEQDQVAPMRVDVERLGAAIERAPSVGPAPEDGEDSAGNLLSDLEQREQLAGTGRAFDLEALAIVAVQVEECPHDQLIDRHPYRTAPVRVAAEAAGF